MRVEEALYAAMREPRRNRMTYWGSAFDEHQRHASFAIQGWAFSREVGFTCGCSGCDQEWRISLTSLRSMLPQAREAYLHLQGLRRHPVPGTKLLRRDRRRADARAKALLHRALSREQRWELRATKAFTVQGKDDKTYLITEGSTSNVKLLENGVQTHSLCVVAKGTALPVHDLMLAQKLLLEHNPEAFWGLAVVRDLRPQAQAVVPEITDEDLEDPTEWVHHRLDAVG